MNNFHIMNINSQQLSLMHEIEHCIDVWGIAKSLFPK